MTRRGGFALEGGAVKLFAILAGWVLVIFGAAAGAVVVESLLYRRRVRRESNLHARLGVGADTAANRR